MSTKSKLEYIWLDGYKPTQSLRSKTRIESDFGGTLEECPMWSFDGSPMKGVKHANHSASNSWSHSDNMLGIAKVGDDLEITISGNHAGRKSRAFRFATRYNSDTCINTNYYGSGNSMTHKFTVTVLEDAADTTANTMTWTETNVKAARSCVACQASSGRPSWCYTSMNTSGYSDHRNAVCPERGYYTGEQGAGWEPTGSTFGPQTTTYHMHTASAPSTMPALRTVDTCQ